MSLPVANVDITTDTFGIWVVKTNTLAYYMSNHVVTVDQTASGNGSSGNGYIVGNFGSTLLFANSELRGGNVSTTGTLNISSNVALSNTITISGASVLSNTLNVTGAVTFSNVLTVTGNTNLSNNFSAGGFANIAGTLMVTGATTLRNSLSVNNAVTASNTLAVTGAATFSNTATVTGLTTLNGNVNTPTANATTAINVGANANINTTSFRITGGVSNTIITNNSITIGNSTVNTVVTATTVDVDGTLVVDGLATLNANLAVTGNATFANSITVTRSGTFSNTLAVTGATTLSNTLNVAGSANVVGSLTVNGATIVANTLSVTGLANLNAGVNTTTANASVALNVGANVVVNTTSIQVSNSSSIVLLGNNSIFVGNSTVNATINSTAFSGISNNSTNLSGQPGSYYTNATNITTGTLNTARLPATANVTTAVNVGANVNLTTDSITVGNSTVNSFMNATTISVGNTTLQGNLLTVDTAVVRGDLTVNGNFYVSATLTANGSLIPSANNTYDLGSAANTFRAAYVVTVQSNTGLFDSVVTVGNSTVNSTVNSTAFSGTANNSTNFNGQPASFYANATNITSGTLNTARLPATANLTTAVNVGANVNLTTTQISVGNSTVNTQITGSLVDIDGTLAVTGATTLANTLTVTGLTTVGNINGTTANVVTLNAGANVALSTTGLFVGNSTVNASINSTAFSGRSNTANTLATARNIGVTGDVVASNTSFNGSANINITVTLAASGVTPGEYTKVTVDSKGRVTNAAYITNTDVTTTLGYIPANIAGDVFAGNTAFNANVILSNNSEIVFQGNSSIYANGGIGTAGQVLHSSGNGLYWDTDDQGVTSVATGNGLSGTITTTGTIQLVANTGLIANTTGLHVAVNNGLSGNSTALFVNANTGLVSNSTGVHVNTAFINAQRANTANTLTTARNIGVTGDVVASNTSFNGSANINITVTLANSGVTAGEYSKVTVDAKGRVTNGAYISNTDVISALAYTPYSANSGGVISANVEIFGTTNATRSLTLNTVDVRQRIIDFKTNSLNRWRFTAFSDAESGSDAGSTFYMQAYNDAGSLTSNIYNVVRATGQFNHTTPVNFNSVPTISTTRKIDAFPSGTKMLFAQTAAPTGWTKDTNPSLNHALRLTGGTAGSGGSWGFTDAFTLRGLSGSVGGTTLSWGQMPVHSHTGYTDEQGSHTHSWPGLPGAVYTTNAGSGNIPGAFGSTTQGPYTNFSLSTEGNHAHSITTYNAGNNEAHGHSLSINNLEMSVAYIDVIMATKD